MSSWEREGRGLRLRVKIQGRFVRRRSKARGRKHGSSGRGRLGVISTGTLGLIFG